MFKWQIEDLVSGIIYLHGLGIIHGNIKRGEFAHYSHRNRWNLIGYTNSPMYLLITMVMLASATLASARSTS